jgi:small-conductance mechanosensitive channel
LALLAAVWLLPCRLAAQVGPSVVSAEPSSDTALLVFAGRPIVTFRARVLGRPPADRALAARRALDDLAAEGVTGPVAARPFEGGILLSVGQRSVIALTAPDIDELQGETLAAVAAQVTARLRQALDEAAEARTPALMMRAAANATFGIAVGWLLLWGVAKLRRRVAARLALVARRTVARTVFAEAEYVRASHLLDGAGRAVVFMLQVAVVYVVCTFVLRQFPYTRPWGETMRASLLGTAGQLGAGVAGAVPGLFTALVIFAITRAIVRLVGIWFGAIEAGRLTYRWIYPETAPATRRLSSTLIWLFGIVAAYPYLPGSGTEAFKGLGVFLGLMVTLGSSGFVNQIMGGLMVTYSRALRVGDFVKIGDVEGTVIHLGVLSTKIRSLRNEEVTIPNAVVVSQTTVDYSRLIGGGDGVMTETSVTIGYDAPWRQVQALLLLAADRTAGLRHEPRPVVVQTALQDFYVKYTLMVCLESQAARLVVFDALHANIQDLFNEHGVQIMSPNYVFDPSSPKVVDRSNWFAPPADRTALNDARPARS